MKAIKFFAMAAFLVVSTGALAQSSKGWNTFYVEYNPISYNVDISGADDESMTGFSVGYSKAFAVSPGTPLFVEAGLAGQYIFKSDFMDIDDFNFNMISAKVPVNLAYKFDLKNSSVSFIPYVGVVARFNISGNVKYTGGTKDLKYDLFDKKDMEELKLTADGKAFNRFQIGWQIGIKAKIGDSFILGLSYGSDFSEITKKVKVSTPAVMLGYTF